MINIFDLSAWQGPGNMDYDKIMGISAGAICRASLGSIEDKSFENHYNEITKRNGLVGAYHFLSQKVEVTEQVKVFINQVQDKDIKLGIWLDVEMTKYSQPGRKEVSSFISYFEEMTHKKLGIYTSMYMWDTLIGDDIAKEKELWIANYETEKPELPRTGGWKEWKIWQYTNKFILPGCKGYLDMNKFNGNEEEFKAWTGAVPGQPGVEPSPPTTTIKEIFKVIKTAMKEIQEEIKKVEEEIKKLEER